jgi:dephospho-CoA kinase
MWVVGLTGGIASGKSTVAALFARRGIPIVDTDVLAREAVSPGSEGLAEVVAAFGPSILTAAGELDRPRLRQRIFADPGARSRLEAILHPRIDALARERIASASGPYGLLVVPLLVEKGWQDRVDRVLVVDAPEADQLARLQRRDSVDAAAARAALASQSSRAQRLAVADDVIDNQEGVADLDDQVARLHQDYLRRAATV